MATVAVVLGLFFVTATVASSTRDEHWWIRIWDFPRVQLAALGLLAGMLLLTFSAVRERPEGLVLLAAIAACLGFQATRIVHYTPLVRKQTPGVKAGRPGATIKLFISNVKMDNPKSDQLLSVIRAADPDVVVLVETNHRWEQELRPLEQTHRHTVKAPLDNTYGMLAYSRFELFESKVEYLVQDDIPSVHTLVKLPCGELVEFHSIHPRPPAPTESKDSTPRDVELVMVAKTVRLSSRPVIVAGDLNDVAWSRTTRLFQKISRLLDPRVGRGMYSTFHAHLPFLRFPLDHIFHSTHFRLVRLERMPDVGSDHFPVLVELSYEPESSEDAAPLDATGEDLVEATQKERKLEE